MWIFHDAVLTGGNCFVQSLLRLNRQGLLHARLIVKTAGTVDMAVADARQMEAGTIFEQLQGHTARHGAGADHTHTYRIACFGSALQGCVDDNQGSDSL